MDRDPEERVRVERDGGITAHGQGHGPMGSRAERTAAAGQGRHVPCEDAGTSDGREGSGEGMVRL